MTAGRYHIPAGAVRVEEEIKRSRFITSLAPAPTVEAARALIAAVSAEFADANHNCWAYVVGPPGSTGQIGMSDDGEPHGTAGRPMLNVLLHSGIGDIVAVVTRYFGGTLLGILQRACIAIAEQGHPCLARQFGCTGDCVLVRRAGVALTQRAAVQGDGGRLAL